MSRDDDQRDGRDEREPQALALRLSAAVGMSGTRTTSMP